MYWYLGSLNYAVKNILTEKFHEFYCYQIHLLEIFIKYITFIKIGERLNK